MAFPIMKLAAALMFACPSPVPVAPAGTALLQSGEIRFHTIDEAKDGDTVVTVTVRDRRGQTIALLTGVLGRWAEDAWSALIPLNVTSPPGDLARLWGGTINVRIDPEGDDTWAFTFHTYLHFSDGQTADVHQRQLAVVNEDRRDWTTIIR
ncbi:hypothetical protein [Nonomuraea sp. NPDC049141]|uniref:hypothetical protein n=1 Tax=unclassified Nonomuraea TaxID=2593643 RepID=UPI0033ECA617